MDLDGGRCRGPARWTNIATLIGSSISGIMATMSLTDSNWGLQRYKHADHPCTRNTNWTNELWAQEGNLGHKYNLNRNRITGIKPPAGKQGKMKRTEFILVRIRVLCGGAV